MTALDVHIAPGDLAKLKRLEISTPKTFNYAVKGAVRRAKNRFASVVVKRGGKYGVPKIAEHNPFTVALRAKQGPVFGKFGSKDWVFMYPMNGGWVVGWPDRVSEWMSANQGAQSYTFDKENRHYFHRRLGAVGNRDYPVPPSYVRPARLVAEPFGQNAPSWFPEMVIKNFERKAARLSAKGKEVS